jgi:hypothetical protein
MVRKHAIIKWMQQRVLTKNDVIKVTFEYKGGVKLIEYVHPTDKKIFFSQKKKLCGGKYSCYVWDSPCYSLNWFRPNLAYQSRLFPVKKSLIIAQIFVDCKTPWDRKPR